MSGATVGVAGGGRLGRVSGRALARALIAVALLALVAAPQAWAANSTNLGGVSMPSIPPGERMLVESDQLLYDYDHNTVAAVGNVKIYYAGYTLEADKVSYNKTTGRLIASGHVKLVDPTGAAAYSDYIDITDDFRDGFVNSLRVDTPQRTHFGAASAERTGGEKTVFTKGTYTACEPCKDHPEKPPLWNVRAAKIVVDHKAHMVYFTDASMEFLGVPVAWMPYFAIPDPTVKRASGFLSPSFGYAEKLGFFGSVPYYWAIAPNKDMTFTSTLLSRQGYMGQVEWRHRLSNGQYAVKVAGIYQADPLAFPEGSPGRTNFRGGINTTGEFHLTRDWTLGWDGTLSTDRTFTRDYGVLNHDNADTISTIHLTGLRDRNYFEARGSYYQVLTNPNAQGLNHPQRYAQGRQAIVVPEIDSKKYLDVPVLGGEVSFTSNLTSLTRAEDNSFQYSAPGTNPVFTHGTAGTFVRVTKQVDWQRRFIGPMGQVIVPFASLRGDAFFLNGQSTSATAGVTSDSTVFRFMPTVGVDWSLPILATTPGATHIIEPRAQLIVRPDEMSAGVLPNNDAQSLVFDVSSLFDRNKFSGYDRVEGGTRLNVGVHYNGSFSSGASVDATFGESFQLAGTNPYATQDLAGVGGPLSGLETTASDYVAGATIDTGLGPRIIASGRFDNADFSINRGEVQATAALGPVSASAAYLYVRNNPYSDTLSSASVIRGAASLNLSDNWRAFGTAVYDISNTSLVGDSVGLAFDNECATFAVAYSQTLDADLKQSSWLNFRLELRTLGNSSLQTNLVKAN